MKLVVISTGALTSVGLSSEPICASTRAGISAYEESNSLLQTAEWEPIIASAVPFNLKPTENDPFSRCVAMADLALVECLAKTSIDVAETALLLGLPEAHRFNRFKNWIAKDMLVILQEKIAMKFHSTSQVLPYGNASVVYGLLKARELLRRSAVRWCVVGGVDTFLNSEDLNRLEHSWRLNREGVSQGFVPGEGAAFVAVTTPDRVAGNPVFGIIAGIGIDKEGADTTVLSDGHPTGKGLERALMASVRDAGTHESEVGLRISDLNGERYGALDSMLAVSRFYRTDRNGLPIWHPAEFFGETGAAVGALLLIIGCDGILHGYISATTVMCEVSSEGGLRGACLLRATEQPPTLAKIKRVPQVQRPVIPFIVSQHAEEAGFLWEAHDTAVLSPIYNLEDLSQLDDRLNAHIDALLVAGDFGWDVCKEQLSWEEPGTIAVASMLALESEDEKRIDVVMSAGSLSKQSYHAMISALGWMPFVQIDEWLQRMLSGNSSIYRSIAIAGCHMHRVDPGPALVTALNDTDLDPHFFVNVLQSIGELKRHDLLPFLQQQFHNRDMVRRFWAARSAVLLGDHSAMDILKGFMDHESQFRENSFQIILRVMDIPNAKKLLGNFMESPKTLRFAIQGAGINGNPLYLTWLLNLMEVPEYARVAGESFSMITGVDIAYEDLEAEWPEGFEVGPTEEPEDEDVDMDPDEDLPWPEPELIKRWWKEHERDFKKGERYLCGKPMTIKHLQYVLRYGYQRQRNAAALELAIRQPGTPLFETRAPGFRQQKLLKLK